LAAILLHTGYKLAKPTLFQSMFKKGLDQFIPFTTTVVAIVFTDLLMGVGVGIVVATFYILRANMQNAYKFEIKEDQTAVLTLAEEVSFLNKAPIQQKLYSLPKNIDKVVINGKNSKFIDKDVLEVLKDFEQNALSKGLEIELQDITTKRKTARTKQHKLEKIV
jgi:MFS superfamily sulfate permease-like transporter